MLEESLELLFIVEVCHPTEEDSDHVGRDNDIIEINGVVGSRHWH